jgi:predicted AlkP superfamily phosphohydrolase/phosphomutase
MIGVDAAEISYIRENLYCLPNFRRALDRGTMTELTSQAALIPGSVWPSFFTASGPGEHGFHLILAWDRSAMKLRRVTAKRLPMRPFWRQIASEGGRVVAVDVPMVAAPEETPGVEVTGWGSHDGLGMFSTQPRGLKQEIKRRFGRHPIGLEIPVAKTAAERERIKRQLVEGAEMRANLIKWLIAAHDWDLLVVVFSELHRGGHILWPLVESIPAEWLLEVYRAVDRALGEILGSSALEEATVGLFALHGMGPNHSPEHFTQEIVARINARFGASEGGRGTDIAPRGLSPINTLRQRLPARVQSEIAQAVPQWARDAVVDRSYTAGFDWRRTPGIAVRSDRNGYIRLNLRGRERDGMLEPGSAAMRNYLEDLREGFVSFRTEHGEPLVEAVHLTRDAAPGRNSDLLPDVIVTWNESRPTRRITSPIYGQITAQSDDGRTGHHRTRGFLIMMDPDGENAMPIAPRIRVEEIAAVIRARLADRHGGEA